MGQSKPEVARGKPGPAVVAGLTEWRRSAFEYVAWVSVVIALLPLTVLFLEKPPFIPIRFRLLSLGIFLMLLALAIGRRLPFALRAWGLLLTGYAFAGVILDATGLHGSGRLFLLVLPLYAVALLGLRSGWAAAGLSIAIYCMAALFDAGGLLAANAVVIDSTVPSFWVLQGTVLIMALAPVMVLLARFIGLLQGTLADERRYIERLKEVAGERRQLERVILETGERERRAVGYQLHDGPCQQITAALLRCKVAENALAAREADESVAHVRAIQRMLDDSVGEIHDLARGLSPPEMAPDSLASALREMVRRVCASDTVKCEFVCEKDSLAVSPSTSTQLFRIAQEALSNAVRHAKARHIRVSLAQNDGILTLDVLDDGIGVVSRDEEAGMGLRIMRYRAELIGGALEVERGPDGGTHVACRAPSGIPEIVGQEAP